MHKTLSGEKVEPSAFQTSWRELSMFWGGQRESKSGATHIPPSILLLVEGGVIEICGREDAVGQIVIFVIPEPPSPRGASG